MTAKNPKFRKLSDKGRAVDSAEADRIDDFSTVAQAVTAMGVSKTTVYRLIHTGALEAYRSGYTFQIPRRAILAYLSEKEGSHYPSRPVSRDRRQPGQADLQGKEDQVASVETVPDKPEPGVPGSSQSTGPDGDNSDDSLARLMAKVANGDQAAFEGVYDALAGPVYGLIMRVLRDPAIAEEVAQEVLLEVWRTAARWDPTRNNVATWVLTIAHRRAVDRVRSAAAEQARNARRNAEASLDRQSVSITFDGLTKADRECIMMVCRDGYSYQQVADRLNIALSTVKKHIRNGINHLVEEYSLVSTVTDGEPMELANRPRQPASGASPNSWRSDADNRQHRQPAETGVRRTSQTQWLPPPEAQQNIDDSSEFNVSQLDALLSAVDDELLDYIRATASPDKTLLTIMRHSQNYNTLQRAGLGDRNNRAGDDLEQFVAQVGQDDEDDFEAAYSQVNGPVFDLIYRLLADPAQSEDEAQEVLLAAVPPPALFVR